MAKPYRLPDFKKLYPEAQRGSHRCVEEHQKEKCSIRSTTCKTEQTVIDMKKSRQWPLFPSREDSYERIERSSGTVQGRRTGAGGTGHPASWRAEQLYIGRSSCLSEDDRYLIRSAVL